MASMTLVEAAKLAANNGDTFRSGVIELYAGSSDILANLPFMDIQGNALRYNRETALPGIGFRGVNESYTPSVGVINPLTESLVIAGGELDVDPFLVKTMGMGIRTTHEAMKIRALSLRWTKEFIKGDTASDARVIDGLQTRATGSQVISAGTTANGAALSLAKMDEAIDQTLNPTHIIMNKALVRRFSAAARTTSVSGYVTYDIDQLGKRVMQYNGIPILTVDLDDTSTAILGFTEAADSGTSTATSIYVVSMGADSLTGIQNGGIDVQDLGLLQSSPLYRTRVEWYNGLAAFNGRSITRLKFIGDLAIVA
jgi:hypothetical protein